MTTTASFELDSSLIPEEWELATIGSFGEIISGNAFKSKQFVKAGVPVVKISNVQCGHYIKKNQEYLPESYMRDHKRFVVNQGDLLMALTRPITNNELKICRYPFSELGLLNQRVAKISTEGSVSENYIHLFFLSRYFKLQVQSKLTETLQPNLSPKDLARLYTAFPPLAEQKVIADKLDSLLAQVETTKARLDRIPDILKRFRQSVLAAAVSGRLTEEWRGIHSSEQVDIRAVANEMFESGLTHGNFGKKSDRAPDITQDELPLIVGHLEKWPLIRIGALCACVVPNRDKPKKFSGGYHWLLTPNFHEQSIWIDYSSIEKGLSEKEVNTYKAKVIKHGNVIMTCVGRLGLSAVLEEDAVINQQLHAFLVNDFIEPEYLAYCIRANTRFFEDKSTSTTVSYLNKTACNSLPIPLPTLEEQAEIIRRVEQLFTLTDTIEQKAQAATERVNKLTQSILAKAFRGDLTKDWRAANPDLISGENSAEALLEKIKAEREVIKPKKKTRAKKEKA